MAGREQQAADQARQWGMHNDGVVFFPINGSSDHGLLVQNNEYTDDGLLFSDGNGNWTPEKTAKSQDAHGVSVIEIRRTRGRKGKDHDKFDRRDVWNGRGHGSKGNGKSSGRRSTPAGSPDERQSRSAGLSDSGMKTRPTRAWSPAPIHPDAACSLRHVDDQPAVARLLDPYAFVP
jgi:hypothetical protein